LFYVIYLEFTESLTQLVHQLKEIFTPESEITSSDNQTLISADWATLRLSAHGQKIDFAREDYGLPFNICIWVDVISEEKNWSYELMRLTGRILDLCSGACTLEANGEKPILLRNQSGLFIDGNLGGSDSMPFYLLERSWTETSLYRPES